MSSRNILIAQFSHETNTFSSIPADIDAFRQRGLRRGKEILRGYSDTNTPLGGMLSIAESLGWNVLPVIAASAHPSGPVTDEAYRQISEDILRGIRGAKDRRTLDGVLLALHGAMVTESLDDGEGNLLQQVQDAAGPDIPVVCTLDFHANLTPEMTDSANLLFGYNTYPHIDGYQRGEEAARALHKLLGGQIDPQVQLRKIPLLIPLVSQKTEVEPFAGLVERARRLESQPGMLEVCVYGGFPYADIPAAGASVIAVADGQPEPAQRAADELACAAMDMREKFLVELPGPQEAVSLAGRTEGRPVVLADVADNPGAGGSCRHVDILRALINQGVDDAAVFLADPAAVDSAFAAGVGSQLNISLGEADSRLRVEAYVRSLTDGKFIFRGPQSTGLAGSLGRTALLLVEGIEVMVSENRVQTRDPQIFRSVGIEPARKKILALKSSVHYRAAFEPLAEKIIEVAASGVANPQIAKMSYSNVKRPVFPLDGV